MSLPTQFGPYLLLERISVGGMAEVFKAKEYGVEGFERTVAVKRILPHVAEDDEFIAMFKDEAKIAVQLNHGNIAQIYNLGNDQDSFYIALEYVNGRDLRAIFQKGQQQGQPMPIAQACYIIMKICEGLDYAHNKKDKYNRELNIVHRDVSPPNILVSFEGEVKLIDFGVAKAAGRASRTQAGILKGKFGYMSPEQVRGMPLDRRSDVFSVGVVLFEVLTGTRLFQADTDFATLEKVRAVEVPRPSSLRSEIPKPLENIIYKALAREPEPRYQSAIDLHDELQAFMFAQGLFYSRKELAAWMRQQYTREIELAKDKLTAPPRPPGRGPGTPPPPPGASRRTVPPPPPGARASTHPGRDPDAPSGPAQRRTMVMTTSRPAGLPATSRAGGAGPRGLQGETHPGHAAQPLQSVPQSNHGPAAGGGARPQDDLDWEDDELETRLFNEPEQGSGRHQPPAPGAAWSSVQDWSAERPSAAGGELATARAQERTDPAVAPARVTVVPGLATTDVPVPRPLDHTVVAPMPAHPGSGGVGPGVLPPPSALMGTALGPTGTQASPVVSVPPGIYGEGAPSQRSTKMVVGLVLAVLLLLGVGFAAVYLLIDLGDDEASAPLAGADGAANQTGEVTVAEGSAADGKPTLAIPTLTTLTVQSTPTDAELWVDGQKIESVSPHVVRDLKPGTHHIRLSAAGRLPFEREVEVAAQGLTLPVTLDHQKVALTLKTEPAKASLSLVSGGKTTPLGEGAERYELTRERGSSYELEASAAGYVTARTPIEFTGEATQAVDITLVREQAKAADERPSPGTKPAQSHKSSHKPSTGTPAGRRADKGRTPKPQQTTRPSTPKPDPRPSASPGTLKIGINPGVRPAQVFVDGNFVGMTPVTNLSVSAGKHKVTWKWSDGREVSMTVSVGEGEVKVVKNG